MSTFLHLVSAVVKSASVVPTVHAYVHMSQQVIGTDNNSGLLALLTAYSNKFHVTPVDIMLALTCRFLPYNTWKSRYRIFYNQVIKIFFKPQKREPQSVSRPGTVDES